LRKDLTMGKTFRFDPKNPSKRKNQLKNETEKKGPDKRNAYDIDKRNAYDIKDIENHTEKKNYKHGHYDKQRIWHIPEENKNKKGPKF